MIQCENLANNVIIGDNCLPNSNTGLQHNILIGDSVDLSNNVRNTTCIGTGVTADVSNEVVIGNGDVTVWRNDGDGNCDLGASGNRFKDVYLNCGVISDVSRIIFCDPSGSSISSGNSIDINTNALNVGSAPVYSSYSDNCGNALANQQWVQNNTGGGGGSDLSGITQDISSNGGGPPFLEANTALGVRADPNANGTANVAIGFQALHDPSSAIATANPQFNVVVGALAFSDPSGFIVNSAEANVVVGYEAARDVSGEVTRNVIIGTGAQQFAENIIDNVVIGVGAGVNPGVENSTCIGTGVTADVSNEVVIGNGSVTTLRNGGFVCDLGTELNPFNNLYLSGDISGAQNITSRDIIMAFGGNGAITFQDGTQQSTAAGGSDLSGITQTDLSGGNTALGVGSGPIDSGFDGSRNVAIGNESLVQPGGSSNDSVAIGYQSSSNSTSSFGGVAIGYQSLQNIQNNGAIGVGYESLKNTASSNKDIAIGYKNMKGGDYSAP